MKAHYLASAALLFVSLTAHGERTRELRTGPEDSYVVFGNGGQGAVAWFSRGGGDPTAVPLLRERWILDAVIDDERHLWVALGPSPRGGPVHVLRYGDAQPADLTVQGAESAQEVHLLSARSGIHLATPGGLWTLDARGAKQVTSWSPDSYGFYAATFVHGASGWRVLAPTFNTCSSADRLESLALLSVGPGGAIERRAVSLPSGGLDRAWLGADGWHYATGCDGDTAVLAGSAQGRGWPPLHRERSVRCTHDLLQNGRFTIVLLGETLVRVEAGRVERLGRSSTIESYYPDRRGRALVLNTDGSLVRFSSRRPPESVARVAALPQE